MIICCYTRPFISWAQVANSINYKIIKSLSFPKIENSCKLIKEPNSWEDHGSKIHNDRQYPKEWDQVGRWIFCHQALQITKTQQPNPTKLPIDRKRWLWKQWTWSEQPLTGQHKSDCHPKTRLRQGMQVTEQIEILDMGGSYWEDRFESKIKRITNYVGINFD